MEQFSRKCFTYWNAKLSHWLKNIIKYINLKFVVLGYSMFDNMTRKREVQYIQNF